MSSTTLEAIYDKGKNSQLLSLSFIRSFIPMTS